MANQPGRDITTLTLVSLLAVVLFTVMAGMSDDMGKLMVVLMSGFLLGWMLLHSTQLGNMVKSL